MIKITSFQINKEILQSRNPTIDISNNVIFLPASFNHKDFSNPRIYTNCKIHIIKKPKILKIYNPVEFQELPFRPYILFGKIYTYYRAKYKEKIIINPSLSSIYNHMKNVYYDEADPKTKKAIKGFIDV